MPFYSLETIHEVAKDKEKIFLSRLAQRDSSNLGYNIKDIAKCIRKFPIFSILKIIRELLWMRTE